MNSINCIKIKGCQYRIYIFNLVHYFLLEKISKNILIYVKHHFYDLSKSMS